MLRFLWVWIVGTAHLGSLVQSLIQVAIKVSARTGVSPTVSDRGGTTFPELRSLGSQLLSGWWPEGFVKVCPSSQPHRHASDKMEGTLFDMNHGRDCPPSAIFCWLEARHESQPRSKARNCTGCGYHEEGSLGWGERSPHHLPTTPFLFCNRHFDNFAKWLLQKHNRGHKLGH